MSFCFVTRAGGIHSRPHMSHARAFVFRRTHTLSYFPDGAFRDAFPHALTPLCVDAKRSSVVNDTSYLRVSQTLTNLQFDLVAQPPARTASSTVVRLRPHGTEQRPSLPVEVYSPTGRESHSRDLVGLNNSQRIRVLTFLNLGRLFFTRYKLVKL